VVDINEKKKSVILKSTKKKNERDEISSRLRLLSCFNKWKMHKLAEFKKNDLKSINNSSFEVLQISEPKIIKSSAFANLEPMNLDVIEVIATIKEPSKSVKKTVIVKKVIKKSSNDITSTDEVEKKR